ncbi:MAG: hypothetical protein ACUVWX_02255 [Kiritimatiellia bacterium]
MRYINAVLSLLFRGVLRPLRSLHPLVGISVLSFLGGFFLLCLFKALANPHSIRSWKGKAIAALLELLLFQHDPIITLGAFGRMIRANLHYLAALVPATLVGIPLFLVFVIYGGVWFAVRPLRPGETAVLTVQIKESFSVMNHPVSVAGTKAIVVDEYPIRNPRRNQITWQVRAVKPGEGWVEVEVNGQSIRKSVVVGHGLEAVSRVRVGPGFWRELFHPAESPLPEETVVSEISVSYPTLSFGVGHWKTNWLTPFFFLTFVVVLLLRKPLGVEL